MSSRCRTPTSSPPRAPRWARRRAARYKSTRPDTLLAHVLRACWRRCRPSTPKRIEDVIVGCAMPEYEQGMNVARIGLLLAGLPLERGRHDDQPLLLVGIERGVDRRRPHPHRRGRHHDRRRHREHEHDPDAGPARDERGACSRTDENVGIAYGMGLTAEKVAAQWKVSREDQDAFALASHQKALAAQAAGEFDAEISALTVHENLPDLATDAIVARSRKVARDEGPRADTTAEGLAKLRPVFAAKGIGDRGQQFADVRRRRRVDPRVRARAEGTRPHAARALGRLCGRRRAAGDHGHRSDRRDPQGAADARASRRTRSTGSNSTKRSPRRASR